MKRHATVLALVAAVSAVSLQAAEITWEGALSADFATAGNWQGGVTPATVTIPPAAISDPMGGDVIVFGDASAATYQPYLGASWGVGGIRFDGAGWTLGGNSGALLYASRLAGVVTTNTTGLNIISADLRVGTRDQSAIGFSVAGSTSDGVLRLTGTLGRFADNSGGGAVIKAGGGTLELAVGSGAVGAWQLQDGAIKVISGQGGFGTNRNVRLVLMGGTLDINGNNITSGFLQTTTATTGIVTNSSATSATFRSEFSGNADIYATYAGNLNVGFQSNGDARTITPRMATSSYTGNTFVENNVALILNDSALVGEAGLLGAGTTITLGSSGTNLATRNTRILANGPYEVAKNITMHTGNDLRWLGMTDSASGVATFSGTITVGTSTVSPATTLATVLTAGSAGRAEFTGNIVDHSAIGLGSIIKRGVGVVRLSGNNTYAGGTIVETGTLLIDSVAGSGTGPGTVIVWDKAVLGGGGTIAGVVTLADDGDDDGYGGILRPTSTTGPFALGGLNAGSHGVLDLGALTSLDMAQSYLVLSYGGPATSFASVLNTPLTHEVSFSPGEVWLVPVPEPGMIGMALAASGLMLMRRKRYA